jgi:hypothetical protein
MVSASTEVGFVRAMRPAMSNEPEIIQMPSNTPDNERWIWENPKIVGEILKGSDDMARGNIVRRVLPDLDD